MSTSTKELTDIMKMVMESDTNSSDDEAEPVKHVKPAGGSLKSNRQYAASVSDISRDTSSLDPAKAICDSVYSEWLSEKKAKIKEKKIRETKSKSELQNEELQAIAKKEQLKADCERAYKTWMAKKNKDMMEKLKIKQQEKGACICLANVSRSACRTCLHHQLSTKGDSNRAASDFPS